jgi:hypothetical protein
MVHRSAASGLISALASCMTNGSLMRPGCHWLFWTVLLQSMYVPSRPRSVSTCADGGAASPGRLVPTELTAAAPAIEPGMTPSAPPAITKHTAAASLPR